MGAVKRRRPTDDWVGRLRRNALSSSLLVPVGLAIAVYAALVPGISSLIIGAAMALVLGLVLLVLALGLERSSTVLLIVAFGAAPLTLYTAGAGITPATGILFLAFVLALPRMIRTPLRLPAMFLVGALLFGTMGLVATVVADSALESLSYALTAILALVCIPMAVLWMAPTQKQIYLMALAFLAGTAASTLYGLPGYTYRNAGFTYHPVALAYTTMLGLSLVPYLIMSKVRGRWLLVPPLVVVALIGTWTSGSRTSLIVLAALVVVVPVAERSLRLGLAVAAGVVLVLPFVFSYDPSGNSTSALSRLFGEGGAQGSDGVRIQTLHDGLRQVQDSPIIGNGYSTIHTYLIHNLYLMVTAAEGIIGLVGLLLMFAALLIPLRTAAVPMRCLAYPALAVVIAGPFQPNMSDTYLGMTLGLSLIAAVSVMNERQKRQPPDLTQPKSSSMMS